MPGVVPTRLAMLSPPKFVHRSFPQVNKLCSIGLDALQLSGHRTLKSVPILEHWARIFPWNREALEIVLSSFGSATSRLESKWLFLHPQSIRSELLARGERDFGNKKLVSLVQYPGSVWWCQEMELISHTCSGMLTLSGPIRSFFKFLNPDPATWIIIIMVIIKLPSSH